MITATFTQFRNNAAKYFDKVEKGERVEIFRNGKPSAVLSPALLAVDGREYWKSKRVRLKLSGGLASRALAEERKGGR